MCDFIDGQQYMLNTGTKSKKSLLFVKLTDSALHSIESFLLSKESSSEKPTIQFNSNNGTMILPVNGQKITYSFTLSNVEADGSNFQCLQHSKKRCLKSLGSVDMKMQIHANEDSYAKTKSKMAAVEKEQKSLCTKEIKPNGSRLKLNKFKHPGSIIPNKITPLSTMQDQSKFLKPFGTINNSTLYQEPIRKRIIHILAIKPYTRPEILVRLMKDGINERDKKVVPDILNEVGVLGDNNIYTLSSQLWSEVEDNWKFCAKEELKLICRRKQQFLKSVNGTSLPVAESTGQKQVKIEPEFKEPLSKKPRISHLNGKKVPNQSKKVSPKISVFDKNKLIKFEKSSEVLFKPVNGHSNGVSNGVHNTKTKFPAKSLPNDPIKLNGIKVECNGSSQSQTTRDCLSELSSFNFKEKYNKITSKEQRSQYAVEYNLLYSEYIELHSKMKNVADKLTSLENLLCTYVEGSIEYKKTRYEIHKLYQSTVQSERYKRDWNKFNALQSQLTHIKNLIMEYDCAES